MPRLSNAQWNNARNMWEQEGASLTAIAKKYQVSMTTIQAHKKSGGWSRDGEPVLEAAVPEVIQAGFAEEQRAPIHDDSQVVLQERVAQLEQELAEAQDQVDAYKPTSPVTMYTTPEEVEEVMGKGKLDDLAAMELADVNRERIKQGLAPFSMETDPAVLKPYRDRLVAELLDRTTKWISPRTRQRVVKMVHPSGNIVQVPVEQQIENEAGQAGTSLWKKRDKGFKLADPYVCQLRDCWRYAEASNGRFTANGYCSLEHAQFDPYLSGRQVENVTTSAMQGSNREATIGFNPNRL